MFGREVYDFLNFENDGTGSFKDRGTTVSVSVLKRKGVTHAFDDSSGNAGSSLAAYCARAAMRCTIYAPADTSPQKLLQARIYGGKVVRVPDSRTAASRAAERAWRSGREHYACHSRNAFFVEGTKTFALEVAENLSWEVPEHLVFPVGGGSLYLGALKGFLELHELGWIKSVPKLHCVQSEACMPVVEAFQKGWTETKPVRTRATIAAGIKVANPPRGAQILEAIKRTGGRGVIVTDHEILAHQKALARTEGIFAEPTSCAALAGLARLVREGSIHGDETVMVPLTGFGLKDMASVAKA